MAKSLVLSVSVGTGCYRHIQIDEGETLLSLSDAILDAFGFMDDHLHSFFMNNRAWDKSAEYVCPMGERRGSQGSSDEVKLSNFRLGKGNMFLYIFDYGDEWRFQIKVLRVINERTIRYVMLKSVGHISQYGYDDDEDEDTDLDS